MHGSKNISCISVGSIHTWLHVKCTLRCVGSRGGCTLSILSDVLVSMYRMCAECAVYMLQV